MSWINQTFSNHTPSLGLTLNCSVSTLASYSPEIEKFIKNSYLHQSEFLSRTIRLIQSNENPCNLSKNFNTTEIKIKEGVFRSWWNSLPASFAFFNSNNSLSTLECNNYIFNQQNLSSDQFNIASNYYLTELQNRFGYSKNECVNTLFVPSTILEPTAPVQSNHTSLILGGFVGSCSIALLALILVRLYLLFRFSTKTRINLTTISGNHPQISTSLNGQP